MAKRIGRVVLGLSPDDLEKLKLDNIDIIAALGKWKEWSKDQVQNGMVLTRAIILRKEDFSLLLGLKVHHFFFLFLTNPQDAFDIAKPSS